MQHGHTSIARLVFSPGQTISVIPNPSPNRGGRFDGHVLRNQMQITVVWDATTESRPLQHNGSCSLIGCALLVMVRSLILVEMLIRRYYIRHYTILLHFPQPAYWSTDASKHELPP